MSELDIEKLKKEAHPRLTSTCPKTGKPYETIVEEDARGSLGPNGAISRREYCSECGQTLGYRDAILC